MLGVATARAEPGTLPAGTYKMDPAHSSLTWKVNHFGLSNYTARFSRFDAILDIDPARPESAKVLVAVDSNLDPHRLPFRRRPRFRQGAGRRGEILQCQEVHPDRLLLDAGRAYR